MKYITKSIAKCIGVGYSIIVEEKFCSEVCFDESDVNNIYLKSDEVTFENEYHMKASAF